MAETDARFEVCNSLKKHDASSKMYDDFGTKVVKELEYIKLRSPEKVPLTSLNKLRSSKSFESDETINTSKRRALADHSANISLCLHEKST